MEGEPNFKKEYDEILAIYSKRKSENVVLTKGVPQLENNIANLEAELKKYEQQANDEVNVGDRIEIAALTAKIHEYQQLIKQVESGIKNDAVEFRSQVTRLNSEHHHHQKRLKVASGVQDQELNKFREELSNIQNTIHQENSVLAAIESEVRSNEELLLKLQAELLVLNEAENQIKAQVHPVSSTSTLESELSELEKTLTTLESQIISEQTHQKGEHEKLASSIKIAKEQLVKEQAESKQKLGKKKALEQQLSSNGSQKLNQLQVQIKRLEGKNAQIQKDIDRLAETAENKKAEKAAHQEQLRKYKEKKERNYKIQMSEAEKTQQTLKKEMNRENEKVADALKLSKSYVSQENLQILQKQLSRHQAVSTRVSLESEESKKSKHVKENEVLKSRIKFLRSSSKSLEQQTQSIVRELKKAGDQLVKEKLAQEKIFNHTTNKLNEYMKEFPDHEKRKELQKIEEKKKKADEKEKLKQLTKIERERKKIQEQKKKEAQEPELIDTDKQNLTAWEKWDKWEGKNLPARDDASLFNKRPFQLALGAVAFLAILFLAF